MAECSISYYKDTYESVPLFFYKIFTYKIDPKKNAAAILVKILAEIYYQKKAFELVKQTKHNLKVPELFTYGTITPTILSDIYEKEYYIKMEYIDRTQSISLTTIISAYPFFSKNEDFKKIGKIGEQSPENICDSIVSRLREINVFLISNGIYHNDLTNPDNTLVNENEEIILLDFGEASGKAGTSGKVFNTLPDCNYIPLEYIRAGLLKPSGGKRRKRRKTRKTRKTRKRRKTTKIKKK